jgi:hypothetical protein
MAYKLPQQQKHLAGGQWLLEKREVVKLCYVPHEDEGWLSAWQGGNIWYH